MDNHLDRTLSHTLNHTGHTLGPMVDTLKGMAMGDIIHPHHNMGNTATRHSLPLATTPLLPKECTAPSPTLPTRCTITSLPYTAPKEMYPTQCRTPTKISIEALDQLCILWYICIASID
jgi:hypothetical protein